jgi:hypothetical protein
MISSSRLVHPRGLELFGVTLFGISSLLLALLIASSTPLASISPTTFSVLALLLFGIHVALVGRHLGTFDPAVWIPVAMLLFYFGMPYARALGAPLSYEAWSVDPPVNLGRGFGTALLTLSAFLTGLHLRGIPDRSSLAPVSSNDQRSVRLASSLVVMAGIVLMIIGIFVAGPSRVLGDYGAVYEAKAYGADFRFFDLGFILAKSGLLGILVTHTRRTRRSTGAAAVAAAILLLFSARLGDRGGMLSFLLPAAWIVSQRIRQINRIWILPCVLAAFIVFPALKEYRETGAIAHTLRGGVLESTRASLYEAGSSVLTFCYTLDLIPAERSYGLGISYLRAGLHLIPNVGLSPGKGFLPDPLVADPAAWLVERIHPAKYAQGGGYGYAAGAEWYFNFGIPGVLLGMVLLGFLLASIRAADHRSPYRLLVSAISFSVGLLIVRNVVAAPLKSAVWSLAAIVVYDVVLRILLRDTRLRRLSETEPLRG